MKRNPWKVKSILSFACLNCPECDFSTKEDTIFQDHALEKHPLSFVFFGKIKSVNISSFFKENKEQLDNSAAMKDGKSVKVINTNDKNVHLDESEKPAMIVNPGK